MAKSVSIKIVTSPKKSVVKNVKNSAKSPKEPSPKKDIVKKINTKSVSTKFVLSGVYLSNFVEISGTDSNIDTITSLDGNFDDLYTTNINEIVKEKSKRYITYIDPNKSKIKLWCTMYDIVQQVFLPLNIDSPCWWCREGFKTMPIGLPLCYHVINDKNKTRFQNIIKNKNLTSDIEDFFETEGVFCSFPCCKAYIIENSPKSYSNSTTLLTLLYYKIFGQIINIECAPSWKILSKWGGHLSIDEYRSSFCQIEYLATPNMKRPFMCATGSYIEEMTK